MVQYKTFCLKHYIVFFKKKTLQPAKLLFQVLGDFGRLEATGKKWINWLKGWFGDFYQLIWHCYPSDTFQTPTRRHLDTFQTPSRHLPDTFQTPYRHLTDTRKWRILGNCRPLAEKEPADTFITSKVKFYVYLVQACSLHKPQSRKSNSQTEVSWTTFQEHLWNLGGTY